MTKKINTIQFIEKATEIHGDKYDYSKVEYKSAKEKITIICKQHGKFEQTPDSHIRGAGCPSCGRISTIKGKTSNSAEFVEKAKSIHGNNKYDYSKVKYKKAIENVIIICNEHGDFLQTPNSHLSGSGCHICGGSKKLCTEEFIEKAKSIHGGDKYDYSKVEYINTATKITIICNEHGEFEQTPNSHLGGSGCIICGQIYNKGIENQRKNTEEFIEKAKSIHGGDKYNYSRVEYINCKSEVIMICKEHGEFLQTPSNHYNGGCIKCSGSYSPNTEEFVEKAKSIHGGDKYDYSKVVYVTKETPIIIICKTHGYFAQAPNVHLRGGGCSCCSKRSYSQKSISYLNFMSKLKNITIQHAENGGEYKIIELNTKVDGYHEINTIFEFHGDYWHGNPKLYKPNDINNVNGKTFGELYQKTLEREQQIKDLGYNLVVMWEHDWDKINKSIRVLQRKFKSLH